MQSTLCVATPSYSVAETSKSSDSTVSWVLLLQSDIGIYIILPWGRRAERAVSRTRKTLVVISGAARGNEVTPLHQSETVSVGGIREWQYAEKRGRYPDKESGRFAPLPR